MLSTRFYQYKLQLAVASFLMLWGRPGRAGSDLKCEKLPACWAHFQQALRFADKLRSAEALSEFQIAYKYTPQPRILANIGRSLYHLGRHAEALDAYKTAAERAQEDVELRNIIQGFIAEVEAAKVPLRGARAGNGAPGRKYLNNPRQIDLPDYFRSTVPLIGIENGNNNINNNNNNNANTATSSLSVSGGRSWLWPLLGVLAGGLTAAAVGGAFVAVQASQEAERMLPVHIVSF